MYLIIMSFWENNCLLMVLSFFKNLPKNKGIFDCEITLSSTPHGDDDVRKSWLLPCFD